jgi:hypothetical protein
VSPDVWNARQRKIVYDNQIAHTLNSNAGTTAHSPPLILITFPEEYHRNPIDTQRYMRQKTAHICLICQHSGKYLNPIRLSVTTDWLVAPFSLPLDAVSCDESFLTVLLNEKARTFT